MDKALRRLAWTLATVAVLGLSSLCNAQSPADIRNEAAARLARQFPFLAKVPRVRENTGDYVVLVHGFTWAKATLRSLGRYLNNQGFHVVEVYYPTRSIPIEEVLDRYVRPAVREHCADPKRRVHFVGHSMGCVAIRKLLTETPVDNLGNVVLLAAPNKGVEMAGFLSKTPILGKMLGKFVRQVSSDAESVPNRLGPVTFSPGIIMGTRSDFPFLPSVLPGADDGVVRVESGRVEGMAELITLPTTHIRLPDTKAARAQVLHFLLKGRFFRHAAPPKPGILTF